MSSNCNARAALVPLVLAATWTTAHADDFVVKVTPDAGQTIDDLQLFSAKSTTSTNDGTTTSVQTDQAITGNLGSIVGGTTYTTNLSTAYGTSVATGFPDEEFTYLNLGLLATSNGLAVLAGPSSVGTNPTYTSLYGSTGVTQKDALAGVQTNSLEVAKSLFPDQSPNALSAASGAFGVSLGGPSPEPQFYPAQGASGSFYRFDASGNATQIGSWSVTPVPEPASMAALGLGGLAMLRRRRK